MADEKYENAIAYLRARFPTPGSLLRFLKSAPGGGDFGFTYRQMERMQPDCKPSGEGARAHIIGCAKALKRERDVVTEVALFARQSFERIMEAQTAHQAHAEAERFLKLLDGKHLPHLRTLDGAFGGSA